MGLSGACSSPQRLCRLPQGRREPSDDHHILLARNLLRRTVRYDEVTIPSRPRPTLKSHPDDDSRTTDQLDGLSTK